MARLEHLEGLGVVERVSWREWALSAGWTQQLRELGARVDVLHRMHQVLRGDPARYRIVGPGQALREVDGTEGPLVGRVVQKGLADELKGGFYAVVETPTGVAYRLPMAASVAEGLREGGLVSFGTRPEAAARGVDRRIAEVARAQEGRYVDAAGTDDGGARRRRVELERLGLVRMEAKGRWLVAPDLLEQLEGRAAANPPRHRVWVRPEMALDAQVAQVGGVWLDRVEARSLAAHGFGLEVRRALERRREALAERGRGHEVPSGAAVVERQRRAVGEGIAARTGRVFLVEAPRGFRGRLEAGPEGAAFAVVSDGRRFVLVTASRELVARGAVRRGRAAGPARTSSPRHADRRSSSASMEAVVRRTLIWRVTRQQLGAAKRREAAIGSAAAVTELEP